MRVPVNEPVITPAAKAYVMDALETGWVSSAGAYIDRFEEAFARFLGAKHAVTTNTGTAALHLALAAIGIGPGDEVIVPDFTMMATVNAVLYTGAKPVFVDAEPETFNIAVAQIEGKITPRTKAILPVHIYGHPCDMDPILAIASSRGLKVVEDAAEVHGARYKDRMCGAIGDAGCFSFYGNKIVTTGEGGMLVTNDDALAERARRLKDLAHSSKRRFWHEELGFNYRMTNLQAALGLGQMENIGTFLAHKRWMADEYARQLGGVRGLRLPVTKPWVLNVFWMYAVLVEPAFGMTKDQLRSALKDRGIDTRDFFYSSASQPIVRKLVGAQGPFPVSEMLGERGMYLPSGLALTQEQIDAVCSAIKELQPSG